MADVNQRVEGTAPPNEWLALSDDECAELQRRASDYDPDELEAVSWKEVDATIEPAPEAHEVHVDPPPPTVDDVARLAASLEPSDQMRLMARLWDSLPRQQRAAVLRFQLDQFLDPKDAVAPGQRDEPIWPAVWRTLFDPANTSQLYSAPQRFDLATIFVVTAAYSILFGGLTALDFGPPAKVMLGSVVTLVAAGQALLRGVMNPRGASIVIGAAAYTFFSLIIWFMYRWAFPFSFFTIVVLNGLIVGAAIGYVAGVLVGGVFLAADAVRGKLDHDKEHISKEVSSGSAD